MKKNGHTFVSKALALLMALSLTLSLAVTSVGAVSVQAMNPADDPLLGTSFAVDATIPLVTTAEGKDVSLSIPVTGVSKSALESAVAAGQVELSLLRDSARPYVNEVIFPYAYAGGPLDKWMTEGTDEHQFTDVKLAVAETDGKTVLNVSFHINNYFYPVDWYTGETYVDYSVPYSDGGYYIDKCGYYDLTAAVDGKTVGSAPVKVAPYEHFYTM